VVGGVLFPVTLLAASLGHGVFLSPRWLITDDVIAVGDKSVTVRHDVAARAPVTVVGCELSGPNCRAVKEGDP
jgi:hypothetical protein